MLNWLSRNFLLFAFILSNCVINAQSTYKNIQIDGQDDLLSYPPCEPSIAINPKNPDSIVGGAILDKVYVSLDGGLTWDVDKLESKYGVYGDPCVVANNKGDFYYLHLSDPTGLNWASEEWLDRIVCQRSKDKGYKWSDGSSIGYNGSKDQDKEWAICSVSSKRVYATWTQFDKYDSKEAGDSSNVMFSCTNRRASKWSPSQRINQISGDCVDDDDTVEGAVPACGKGNEVFVAWARGESIWFDRSMDGGDTWLDKDIWAGEIVGGWAQDIPGVSRCNGMPVTCCDVSNGPNSGTIYINYTDQRNGIADTDVWLISSSDQGDTWTEPLRVNTDGPGYHQFFTWMDVDPVSGHIYIVFYDRRNYDDNRTDVVLATSTDGGRTFTNEVISDSPFEPQKKQFFGDYSNIDAYNGVVRPIWTRQDNGKSSVWTAIINK
jgi:hypothetical protein